MESQSSHSLFSKTEPWIALALCTAVLASGALEQFVRNRPAYAAEEAGKLILDLEALWVEANPSERRKLLMSMLDAVYFDAKASRSIVALRPKPPFKPIFQVAASREGSGIRIINEPYLGSSVFLVEAGESRTPRPREAAQNILQA